MVYENTLIHKSTGSLSNSKTRAHFLNKIRLFSGYEIKATY